MSNFHEHGVNIEREIVSLVYLYDDNLQCVVYVQQERKTRRRN